MRRFITLPTLAMLVMAFCSATLIVSGAASARQNSAHPLRQIAALPTRQEWNTLRPQLAVGAALGSGDLNWNGGQVEEQPRVFLIFWGFAWDNGNGGLTRDGALVTTFFSDVSNTPFQNNLTQYGDRDANPSSSLTVGGIWLDSKNPLGNSQTCGGPTIDDSSIQSEIARAIQVNSWPGDIGSTYLLYTPSGYFVNQGGGPAFCSEQQFCAYHGMSYTAQAPYAVIPFPTGQAGGGGTTHSGGTAAGCMVPNSPNNNLVGDSLVNLSSVEQADVATDPHLDAYFDDIGFEIGDKCAWNFSTGPMTLANGDAFELQTEYSNNDHACLNMAAQPHTPRQGPGTITHFATAAPTQTLAFNESGWRLLVWLSKRGSYAVA